MPTLEKRSVRLPRLAFVVRILFALFLVGTGIMTMGFGVIGYPVGDPPSELDQFMLMLEKTGYLIFWVGLLKTVAGWLMLFPRTMPLAILVALPYAFNILLYVIFFAQQHYVVGIPDFAACALLICCYFEWYRPIFAEPTPVSSHDLHGDEHPLLLRTSPGFAIGRVALLIRSGLAAVLKSAGSPFSLEEKIVDEHNTTLPDDGRLLFGTAVLTIGKADPAT
ncbi:hypothetical protein Pla22_36760 [Rubripirellula amarantea]|uniref:DoxX n=1 Tax=Rubripirellula amarantea TaxID=2527999 RepID=A0A5C5WLS1_9BACT|nr:hypothetical protein Pla22_36760 [Rubripirellula amarantea]